MPSLEIVQNIIDFLLNDEWQCTNKEPTRQDIELGTIYRIRFEKIQKNSDIGRPIATLYFTVNDINFTLDIEGWIGIYTGRKPIQNTEQILTSLQWAIQSTCPP
jgi:hypothetical protein